MEDTPKKPFAVTDQELLEEDDDSNSALKKRISTHPLYGKLVKVHLDCLKIGEVEEDPHQKLNDDSQDSPPDKNLLIHQSDLDHFMEAYCAALSKLREAIEAPHQESMAFITTMHSRLQDIASPASAASNHP